MPHDLTALAQAVGVYKPKNHIEHYAQALTLGLLAVLIIYLGAR